MSGHAGCVKNPAMFLRSTACLALAGCTADPLAWPVPRVTADAGELGFAAATADETNLVALELWNHGTDDAALRATVDLPFRLAADRLDVPAGARRALVVSWTPDGYAAASGELRVTGPLTDLVVPVAGAVDADADDDGQDAEGAGGDDCDDARATVRSGAPELCDDLDNDCNGTIDDDPLDASDWFPDADGDGWGVTAGGVSACDAPGGSWSTRGGDCDDADPDTSPGAVETWYDGIDADCSGGSDHDRDGDGYDNLGTGGVDCQDEDADVNPGEVEIPGNGTDEDCDGVIDELG